ncbi:MAG: Holliday junction branch migration protein RuvA [Arenicellales bacterium]|jgi:Holliday junction DNA helicase RuvA|nr:Holliday junction branch migration protein RuvA [Arenicellales bacterium]HCV20098.1 Holliday junction branch migration protein RuvA [Gammaproteobacteria bacterium]MDP6313739.1 Holliday junction branch migration protein RuvA [Arenicellales bacterium]MDP7119629.1 Holliday junction branch migration protein RuvA [Arenicellales bacterium]MDP7192219.1 Holliday junction branch migration protein RuvA [Arenicellales bacterium]|tara:strand:+ start:262 stop:858 length:597 start_codon:yes stop_codon:yes gene_type:complete
MIGWISGKLLRKQPPQLLVEVGGVGYELEAPMTAFYNLPDPGGMVSLHTHLVIRDDAHLLFGFTDLRQRDLFRTLLKITGVGPRVALAILSGLTADDLVACISVGDVAQLTRVPGIGRKTAERLVIELRDRLDATAESGATLTGSSALTPEQDAVSALVALGYKSTAATAAVRAAASAGASVEELIRGALKELSGERT